MKSEGALQTLTLFFNDLIGAVIPGALLGVGLIIIHVGPLSKSQVEALSNGYIWCIALAFSFGCGHLLSSFHSKVVERVLQKVGVLPAIQLIQKDIEGSKPYLTFNAVANEQIKKQSGGFVLDDWKFNDLRSIAMSVSPESSAVGRRFMFISLLCSGVGAALFVLTFDFLGFLLFLPAALIHYENVPPAFVQIGLMFFASWLCLMRGTEFYKRASSAPFCIALGALVFGEKKEKKDEKA